MTRFTASASDVEVYDKVAKNSLQKLSSYQHVLRWAVHLTAINKTNLPKAKAEVKKDEEEDIDLFGSDDEEEDAEAEKLKAQRLAEYNARKAAGKPKPAAKSMVILDVKPWDDETDMSALTKGVLEIKMDGLVWGANKLVPVGYGIKKLQITCVIEDEKVGVDDLSEMITDLEDYVQSVDVAAFNKL
jgi:elongation factor 1-beta